MSDTKDIFIKAAVPANFESIHSLVVCVDDGGHDQYTAAIGKYSIIEQGEPLAWMRRHGDDMDVHLEPLDDSDKKRGWTQTPLYPITKLSDAQILDLVPITQHEWSSDAAYLWFARAIERALLATPPAKGE